LKYERQVFFKETPKILLTEHLLLLCQILDAATESKAPETKQADVA